MGALKGAPDVMALTCSRPGVNLKSTLLMRREVFKERRRTDLEDLEFLCGVSIHPCVLIVGGGDGRESNKIRLSSFVFCSTA